MLHSRRMIVGFLAGVLVVGASVATAQIRRGGAARTRTGQVSQVDMYGNARSIRPNRRDDVFLQSAQKRVINMYLKQSLRLGQRGSMLPFALPGDTLRKGQRSRDPQPMLPFAASRTDQRSAFQRLQAFRNYGGFSERAKGKQLSEVQRAFARRYDLILATSNAAPVHRANVRHASVAGMLTTIDTTPFDKRGSDLTEPAKNRLADALAYDVEQSHRRLLQEAWDWFRDGEYRRSMRAFESAGMLQPSDYIAKVGSFFARMELGSMRAAHTVLLQLNRRDPNPFLHDVNVAEVLGDRERIALLRLRAQVASDAPARNPDVAAMHAFVAWYLGDRPAALVVADAIAKESPGSPWDEWPGKMRAAIDAGTAPTP